MTTDIEPSQWAAESRPPFRLIALLLVIPVVAVLAFAIFRPIQVLPRIGLAPGFAFTDQDGRRLTSEDLRGKLVIYTFTYTRCTAPCPQTSATLKALQSDLAAVDTAGIPLEYVTISVDPEYDTPERLRAYADALGVDTERWHFVTGAPAALKNVIGAGFSTYYDRTDGGGLTVDPVFVLVDGWGMVRAFYRTATPDPATLARDLRLITQEARNSTGVNRYAYEAAHLFLCYPR
jgi:protein SCO1/2